MFPYGMKAEHCTYKCGTTTIRGVMFQLDGNGKIHSIHNIVMVPFGKGFPCTTKDDALELMVSNILQGKDESDVGVLEGDGEEFTDPDCLTHLEAVEAGMNYITIAENYR